MELWIVQKDKIDKRESSEVCVEEIGQKALGLCRVPSAWTLPFFVVSSEMFLDVCNNKEKEFSVIEPYMDNILRAVKCLHLGDFLIIRSSGIKEGMSERGKYESIIADKNNLKAKILELIAKLACESELLQSGMPLIIQSYIKAEIAGHVSNERRFVKEYRDFVYEYCYESGSINVGNIPLRNWRKTYDIEHYENKVLNGNGNLIEKLKVVCAYYYYQKRRVHIEFIADKRAIYIVQCDSEVEIRDAVNPEEYDVKMFDNSVIFEPKVIRMINENDRGRYKKIDNVFIYKDVGIPMPPFYILDNEDVLAELREGCIPSALVSDLDYMTKRSLVIRTNVISHEKLKSQFSERSNELRDTESAINFLKQASKRIAEEGIAEYIFILHNFVPAKAAAFVNAKPLERIVEIQALWGLPEGLYYNAHDRITVDTREINISKMEKSRFAISKKEVYKESFIAPDERGRWIVKKLQEKYNWRCTIDNEELIRDIADKARKIAERVGDELSIMWFVWIDESFYKTNNMPWYHEEYDRNSYYHTNRFNVEMNFKKKYFYEKELLIETKEDLEKLKIMDAKEIGLVRIKPKEDDILRSKVFIKEFGQICKEKGVHVFLEGAVLAHSFYQLANTGAIVIVAQEIERYTEKIEYNKLVRDKIPDIIDENGENTKCIIMKGVGLIRQLKNKIIEESYEILEANSEEELLEEIADLEEVCIALVKNIEDVKLDKFCVKKTDGMNIELKFQAGVLERGKQFLHNSGEVDFCATLERKGMNLQLDLLFGSYDSSKLKVHFYEDKERKEILKLAFHIFSSHDIQECKRLINEIRTVNKKIVESNGMSQEELEAVRKRKKEKRGGFDEGFVLLETNFKNGGQESTMKELFSEKSPQINYIDIPTKTRVDVENLNSKQLLLRITLPIYARTIEKHINHEKIDEYFERNVDIFLEKRFEDTDIVFDLKVENKYEQLTLKL